MLSRIFTNKYFFLHFFTWNDNCQQPYSNERLFFYEFQNNFRYFSREIKMVNNQTVQNHFVFTNFSKQKKNLVFFWWNQNCQKSNSTKFSLISSISGISERKAVPGLDQLPSRLPRREVRKELHFDQEEKENLKEFDNFAKPLPVAPKEDQKSVAKMIMMRESLAGLPRASLSGLFRWILCPIVNLVIAANFVFLWLWRILWY